ncbi:hypothetical protein N136_02502 [Leifsonia aquatica ATCC 14665]|uniref:Rho termination factor protein n=1 Tax=Leifsonia aquatica ATCC 14665 TaxID=1358026 RepID=U2RQP1_LEIAQ|nr:hypothetical protein N136_02502 [Leifsonia aquatica ATCC 14665]
MVSATGLSGIRNAQGGTVSTKKAEKEAERLLVAARAAVDEAERAVKKLDKRSRKTAEELSARLEQAAKDAKKAVKRTEKTARAAAAQADAVSSGGVAATPSSGIPTFHGLRDRAKAQGIQGYSRMNKAQLLHALGEG